MDIADLPEVKGGCWIWAGSTDRNGYAQRKFKGVNYMIHRLMYENFVELIPKGLTIDHLCRVTTCINPAHLEAVPHRINILRSNNFMAMRAKQTHCANGHLFDEKNTYIRRNGGRLCRHCNRPTFRAYLKERRLNVA